MQLLARQKDTILEEWRAAIYALFPFGTKGFLRSQDDKFANPVGHTTKEATAVLLEAVLHKSIPDEASVQKALEDFMRMLSVQDLRIEQISGVFFLLKPILRKVFFVEICEKESLSKDTFQDFLALESRIDSLSLMAFALCEKQKTAIADRRIDEVKRQQSTLLRWANRQKEFQRGFKEDTER